MTSSYLTTETIGFFASIYRVVFRIMRNPEEQTSTFLSENLGNSSYPVKRIIISQLIVPRETISFQLINY